MARFIAIKDKAGLTEEQFREALNRTGKWRYGKRSWVIKAYCSLQNGKGRLVIESEAPDQAQFEEWLSKNGWDADEIHRVNFIHEAGLIWPMRF